MSQLRSASGCACLLPLTAHKRDEEQPQDRWSSNIMPPSLLMLHTHTHTHARTHTCTHRRLSLVPASHQMVHLLRPSAQHHAGQVVPTDRQPNSPHTSWRAGNVTAPLVGRSNAKSPPARVAQQPRVLRDQTVCPCKTELQTLCASRRVSDTVIYFIV